MILYSGVFPTNVSISPSPPTASLARGTWPLSEVSLPVLTGAIVVRPALGNSAFVPLLRSIPGDADVVQLFGSCKSAPAKCHGAPRSTLPEVNNANNMERRRGLWLTWGAAVVTGKAVKPGERARSAVAQRGLESPVMWAKQVS
ncbi:protein CASC4 [Platysternon megacephalum]|uniref:Protein CASC4 n=1 Tax=Platysternon megacephalum TaxID=55544 RepID=A0A4D9EFN3_9SAUR|nr:protein CASC4 [Platysternon megacephalum]